ncbi:hypothetical protein BGW36DRAFT_309771 [Talaromyces proteolyticus]|uniref:C3H1-type domain-containing protein n=1 Tax=Talaromyces proteolyticus TaxID=1131652 RepID=A0AAD4KI16_9EURO|nr:uncharacterized protein BGW36DRAFT_309771 [Talaromyces proteolyticus]KAH8688870.1 hypothetical protein BGW36DRAFT_309771 [Talaromyces proteolyticus]
MRTRNATAGHPANGHSRNLSGVAPYEMAARSPPNASTKNTKHVPCKFFRQGACQAGPACPFLHSTDATVDSAPCKYFTKGNCKFGAKCALAHILPDGRRVNRPNFGGGGGGGGAGGGGGGHLNLGGRVNPQAFHSQDSALTTSVLSQQRLNGQDSRYVYHFAEQDGLAGAAHGGHQQQLPLDTMAGPDGGLVMDSKYGSPVEESRIQTSPPGALTLRDVQLPASFDSQGISHMARYGPVAASVPSQFGLDLASPPTQRAPSDALRNLRDTAFGSDLRRPTSNFGSSPPAGVIMEDSFQSRLLHSQRIIPRSKVMSASVPRPSALDDWDDSFAMEEDYLPGSLHDDVLTPQEKMRRLSRTEHELSSSQRDLGGLGGMTGTSATKVGSPLASSPSRFGALFARQRQRKEEEALGGTSSSLNHIGSPLRESALNHLTSSPSLRPIGSRSASGDVSPFVSSPTARQSQSSMSMISQQLNNMSLHPSSARQPSSSATTPSLGPTSNARTASSPMTSSRIDEEQGDLVFSMEEEENNKRNSMAWNSSNKSASSTTEDASPEYQP